MTIAVWIIIGVLAIAVGWLAWVASKHGERLRLLDEQYQSLADSYTGLLERIGGADER